MSILTLNPVFSDVGRPFNGGMGSKRFPYLLRRSWQRSFGRAAGEGIPQVFQLPEGKSCSGQQDQQVQGLRLCIVQKSGGKKLFKIKFDFLGLHPSHEGDGRQIRRQPAHQIAQKQLEGPQRGHCQEEDQGEEEAGLAVI